MGTRGLTIVRLNKKVKVAQYGQWDHYPTGQGATIANFIQKTLNLKKFKEKVNSLQWIKDDELQDRWSICGASKDTNGVSFEVAEKFRTNYPELSRDTGAEVLKLIQNKHVTHVKNDFSFLKDSLFCEWAYEIDLDKKIVKIYKGFQKKKNSDDYGPCKVIARIPFKEFTVKKMKELMLKK